MLMICSIGFLILLIACFNYTNTSIALAGTRIKEISLRKVMGSQRKHIIVQFLLEHFLISLLAVLLSQVFTQFITPIYIGLYSNPEYGIWDFSSYDYIVPFLGFILIFTTLISGAYPAFYISKLKTADALRKNLKLWRGNVRELDNALQRAVILGDGPLVLPGDLPPDIRPQNADPFAVEDLGCAVHRFEKLHIERILRLTPDKREAARRLGIGLSSLYRKIEQSGIRPPESMG